MKETQEFESHIKEDKILIVKILTHMITVVVAFLIGIALPEQYIDIVRSFLFVCLISISLCFIINFGATMLTGYWSRK